MEKKLRKKNWAGRRKMNWNRRRRKKRERNWDCGERPRRFRERWWRRRRRRRERRREGLGRADDLLGRILGDTGGNLLPESQMADALLCTPRLRRDPAMAWRGGAELGEELKTSSEKECLRWPTACRRRRCSRRRPFLLPREVPTDHWFGRCEIRRERWLTGETE